MVFDGIGVTRAEAERLGREFCVDGDRRAARYELRRIRQPWVPLGLSGWCCVFLWRDGDLYTCTVHDAKPRTCRGWACSTAHNAANADRAVARYLKANEDRADRLHVLVDGHAAAVFARRDGDYCQRQPPEDRDEARTLLGEVVP
jgi:hypothetical protein